MFENVKTTEVNETYGREEVIIDENVPAVEIFTEYPTSSDVEDSRGR